MEDLEQLKLEVKQSIIDQVGETEYYKMISDSLKQLVEIKETVDEIFQNEDVEQNKIDFKKAVIQELVLEKYTDEDDVIFYVGYYESVLDVFEF